MFIMKRLTIFGIMVCAVGVLFSCNGGTSDSVQVDTKGSELAWEGEYQSDMEGVLRVLKVRLLADELDFDYSITTGEGGVCYSLSGRSILKVGDLEWDEDDEGVAYAVDEYVYDSVCYMAIRLDAKTRNRARVVTDDVRAVKYTGEDASTMMLVR